MYISWREVSQLWSEFLKFKQLTSAWWLYEEDGDMQTQTGEAPAQCHSWAGGRALPGCVPVWPCPFFSSPSIYTLLSLNSSQASVPLPARLPTSCVTSQSPRTFQELSTWISFASACVVDPELLRTRDVYFPSYPRVPAVPVDVSSSYLPPRKSLLFCKEGS